MDEDIQHLVGRTILSVEEKDEDELLLRLDDGTTAAIWSGGSDEGTYICVNITYG